MGAGGGGVLLTFKGGLHFLNRSVGRRTFADTPLSSVVRFAMTSTISLRSYLDVACGTRRHPVPPPQSPTTDEENISSSTRLSPLPLQQEESEVKAEVEVTPGLFHWLMEDTARVVLSFLPFKSLSGRYEPVSACVRFIELQIMLKRLLTVPL